MPVVVRLLGIGLALISGPTSAHAQAGGTTCCGPNVGAQTIAWLQLPTNTTPLLPNPSGANSTGTWIIANLPGYGSVLIIQDAPTNVNAVCTNADFGRNHSPGSFDNVPHLGGAFNYTETVPGTYGPYSWGVTPGLLALAYTHGFSTNGNLSPLPRYQVSFFFLSGKPDICRLIFSTVGLAQSTTNTVSQPATFRSEYDLIYDLTNYPFGPSAETVLDGVYGPPLQNNVSGTIISSAYGITFGGDDFNTGWGLFQPTNDVLTNPLPPGSGFDVFSNPYPAPSNYPAITVVIDHEFRDVFSLTVGYLCCSNCATNCLQVQCASGKTVPCGSAWTFDPPTATTCCTNQIVTSTGTLTNVDIMSVDFTTNGVCPQFITQTWLITDGCGNSNWCSQIVEIDGCCTNCLQVQCPTNKTVQCSNTWSFDPPTATTCCPSNMFTSTGSLTNILITSTGYMTNGACPQMAITENWAIRDGCGNSTNCSQTVVVLGCCPTNCLSVQCPTNKTVQCGTTWTFDAPTATTCCPSNFVSPVGMTNLMITSSGTMTSGVCPQFITNTWLIVDACGNSNTCSQTVTVIDTTPPSILCPTGIVVVPLDRHCQFIVPPIHVIASDNCTPFCDLVYNQTPPAGTTNQSGNPIIVTVTVTDLCGNSNQCHVVVEALDKTGPVITCPGSMTVTNCLVPCVPVTASDNCCPQSQLTITQSPPCGTPLGPGINSVTVTVTDCHGNTTIRIVHLVVSGPQSFLPNLFNTGVDPSHALLVDDAVDPHYALPPVAVPPGMPADYNGNAVAVSDVCHSGFDFCAWAKTATCFVYTPWDLASPASKWIAPDFTNNGCSPTGSYTYTLTFTLPAGLNPLTATISGRWAVDNAAGMYLNSVPVSAASGGVTTNFVQWTPFTIPAGSTFNTGPNVLTFVATNFWGWTGLRVEFTNAYANCANCAPPAISSITPGQTLPVGANATFSVVASGSPPLSYQWYHNNTLLAGDTNFSMQVHAITYADAGLYSVVVSNPCGVVTGHVRLNVIQRISWTNAWWNVASLANPLTATVGPDLFLAGSSPATEFAIGVGSTEDFGLPAPGSQPVNILRLNPQVGATLALPPLVPDGASVLDAYTLIMDLYEPDSSFGTPSTLFQSVVCCLGSTGQDGVGVTLDETNHLHLTGTAGGVQFDAVSSVPLPTGTWNRLVLVVNNASNAPSSTVTGYLNGINVVTINLCTCCIIHPFGPNLSWANGAPFVLSAPTNAASANAEFYLASLQLHGMALDPQTVAALGAPDNSDAQVSGTLAGPPPALTAGFASDTLTLTWSGEPFVLQETGDLLSGIWMDSTLPFTTVQDGSSTQTSATAKPKAPADKPAKFYRLVFRP